MKLKKDLKKIPDSDTLYLTKEGRVYDSVRDELLVLVEDLRNPRPRIKVKRSVSGHNYLGVCYMCNDPKLSNKYKEKSVANLMVLLYKEEFYKKLNRSMYVDYKDGNFMNCSLDNIVICKFQRSKKNSEKVTKDVYPSKPRVKSYKKKAEYDISWVTGEDIYF